MDDLLREFLVETSESLDHVDVQLVRFEHDADNQELLRKLFRLVHTIKGTCGFLGLPRLEALAHAAESLLGRFRDGAPVTRDAVTLVLTSVDRIKQILAALDQTATEPDGSDSDLIGALERMSAAQRNAEAPPVSSILAAAPIQTEPGAPAPEESAAHSTLRVNVETLERLLTMVSELVLTRNQLLEVARQQTGHAFGAPLQRLSQVTTELQDCVMKTRMQPIGHAWHKLPRLVRDLSIDLDKEIGLELVGAETELDRQVLDLIKDPLTHLVRNAADHGIEKRAERLAAGKPARGAITLRAFHAGGSIIIEVGDDGRGLDYERIRAKAFERGLVSESERDRLTDDELAKFIFHPGFSTAARVTSVSGRGVGLDVVHANVDEIGGTIDVSSHPGRGVLFTLTLPLTLAIVPALLVGAGGQQFAAPQNAVVELVRLGADGQARLETLDGGRVVLLRGDMLPLISLAASLGLEEAKSAGDFVAILSVGSVRFGILVDQVFHTEEIVVKPMSTLLRPLSVYSGATILGDGSVVLILDPNGLARTGGVLADSQKRARAARELAGPADARDNRTSLLVFRSGGRRCALPLSAIGRLEEIDGSAIDRAGGQPVMQYHGKLLQLAGAPGSFELAAAGKTPCLILSHLDRSVGFLVEAIIDVVEAQVSLDGGAGPGVLGAAILNGETTDVVDALHYLRAAHPDLERARAARREARRALVIEESPFLRDMIAPVLRAAGFETTAIAAIDQLSPHHGSAFDAVIADSAPLLSGGDKARDRIAGVLAPKASLIAWCDDFEAARSTDWSRHKIAGAVSKFDRQRLVALLDDLMPTRREAA